MVEERDITVALVSAQVTESNHHFTAIKEFMVAIDTFVVHTISVGIDDTAMYTEVAIIEVITLDTAVAVIEDIALDIAAAVIKVTVADTGAADIVAVVVIRPSILLTYSFNTHQRPLEFTIA